MVRLDRFLADGSTYSRSDVKKLIRAGRISVNGSTAVKPDMKVDQADRKDLPDDE